MKKFEGGAKFDTPALQTFAQWLSLYRQHNHKPRDDTEKDGQIVAFGEKAGLLSNLSKIVYGTPPLHIPTSPILGTTVTQQEISETLIALLGLEEGQNEKTKEKMYVMTKPLQGGILPGSARLSQVTCAPSGYIKQDDFAVLVAALHNATTIDSMGKFNATELEQLVFSAMPEADTFCRSRFFEESLYLPRTLKFKQARALSTAITGLAFLKSGNRLTKSFVHGPAGYANPELFAELSKAKKFYTVVGALGDYKGCYVVREGRYASTIGVDMDVVFLLAEVARAASKSHAMIANPFVNHQIMQYLQASPNMKFGVFCADSKEVNYQHEALKSENLSIMDLVVNPFLESITAMILSMYPAGMGLDNIRDMAHAVNSGELEKKKSRYDVKKKISPKKFADMKADVRRYFGQHTSKGLLSFEKSRLKGPFVYGTYAVEVHGEMAFQRLISAATGYDGKKLPKEIQTIANSKELIKETDTSKLEAVSKVVTVTFTDMKGKPQKSVVTPAQFRDLVDTIKIRAMNLEKAYDSEYYNDFFSKFYRFVFRGRVKASADVGAYEVQAPFLVGTEQPAKA